jgi:hypothetical protein
MSNTQNIIITLVAILGLMSCRATDVNVLDTTTTAKRQDMSEQTKNDAGMDAIDKRDVSTSQEKLQKAHEIRQLIYKYLSTSHKEATKHLPSDLVALVPQTIGEVESDSSGNLRVGAWYLNLDGDNATLDYYPPSLITTHRRLWFRIKLHYKHQRWKIQDPGIGYVQAWRK